MSSKNSIWDNFTNQYSITKTLRFELKPVGKTLDFIRKKLIEEDEQRDKDFQKAKRILDDYYKFFIENALQNLKIDTKLLKEYYEKYIKAKKNRKSKTKDNLSEVQTGLRKDIYSKLQKNEDFLILAEKQRIKKFLENVKKWLKSENRHEDKEFLRKFDKWNTYFVNFFHNRKNVFSKDEIPTSIIYRIVHDNLPRFVDDIEKFEKVKKLKDFDFHYIEKNFKQQLGGLSSDKFFSLENFNSFLNQSGIERFNAVVGGISKKDGVKLKGVNELINEYSQKITDKSERKRIRKLKFFTLYKQILSDTEKVSFVLEKFNNDSEAVESIKMFYNLVNAEFKRLERLFSELKDKDLTEVYIKRNLLTAISKKLFDSWNIINTALENYAEEKLNLKGTKLEKWLKQEYFSVFDIEESLKLLRNNNDLGLNIADNPICDYFSESSIKSFIKNIKEKYKAVAKIKVSDKKELITGKKESDVKKIKEFLDSLLELFHFVKPFKITHSNKNKTAQYIYNVDSDFYQEYDNLFETLKHIPSLYDQIRNYLTQKPYSTKKFKLNFDTSDFLSGWSSDFNTKSTLIFRELNEKTKYYLGIIEKKLSDEDVNELFNFSANSNFDVLVYDFQKPDFKNFPRLFIRSKGTQFAPAVKKYNLPVKEILKIYDEGYFKTEYKKINESKYKESLKKLIDYFKYALKKHESYKHFNFLWKNSSDYKDISEFYKDVEISCYETSFKKINYDKLNELIKNGKVYFFQIWNKDFSEFSHGRKNLHTIFWEQLFSEENLKDVVYKLNGGAEMFYRRKSIPRKITHPKGIPISNEDPINNREKSTFKYDIIKDRRYTEDKFLFHCSITLNFKAKGNGKDINEKVNEHIRKNFNKIKILGVDRGERNLIYITLLDTKGNIIMQKSLNTITDDLGRKHDYLKKLVEIEKKIKEARKDWKRIINIKELKEGYLSQIVHVISKLAIEHNAIIVLEDLNADFKRERFKIERQVYQKFEKALLNKFNYLVFKERKPTEIGGALKAYQLTNVFSSFKDLSKQTGIIFYVYPSYTSKIDYKTGFVNLLRPNFINISKAQEFFSKFEYIGYDKEDKMFKFTFKYSKFIKKDKKIKLLKDEWIIYSNGERIYYKRDSKKPEKIDLTKELKKLFENHSIDYESGDNLVNEIVDRNDAKFLKNLIQLLKYVLQLRNSDKDTGEDYILSCVKDENGRFFDTRKAKSDEPKDADANGAYHIGIKGLIILDKLKHAEDTNKFNLNITQNKYLNYITKLRWKKI